MKKKGRDGKKAHSFLRKGSFTVEAACVIPLILLTIFGVISLTFCVYHRSRLTSAACEIAVSGGIAGIHSDLLAAEKMQEKLREVEKTDWIGMSRENTAAEVRDRANVRISFVAESSVFAFHWNVEVDGSYGILRPSEIVRGKREGGKGGGSSESGREGSMEH